MPKLLFRALSLLLFFSSVALGGSNSLVINEFLFDPSGSDLGNEWVEFIAKSDVNLSNWQFTDNDGHVYTLPNFSLKAGEIVVLHIGTGTDDLEGPVYHLYTGVDESWLDNDGDDLLLKDSSGNPVDYVAYGSGSAVDPPPDGVEWNNNIDISFLDEGHSVGLGEDGIDQDDGQFFAEFDSPSPGVPNSSPSLNVSKEGPEVISRGSSDGAVYTITVENTGPGVAYGITLEDDYPENFELLSVVSVEKNGSPVSGYNSSNDGDRVSLTGLPNLLKGDILTVKLKLTAKCSASIGYKTNLATAKYHGLPDLSDPEKNSQGTLDIEVRKGALKPVIEAIAINGSSITPTPVPEAEVGDIITYRISLQNPSDGSLYNVSSEFTFENGLSYQGNLNCNNVVCSFNDGKITATVEEIPGRTEDDTYSYTFDLKVEACENLVGTLTSSEKCGEEPQVSSGVMVKIKNPNIDYTISPDPIEVPYGGTRTVTISVSNNGTGTAFNFKFDTNLEDLPVSISNVSDGWSYDSSTGIFSYSGQIAPSSSVELQFDIRVNSTCSDRAPSGIITLHPDYLNSCGKHFYAPTKYISFSTSGVPTIEISKEPSEQYVAIGNSVSFDITLNVSSPSGINGDITVTDEVPSEIENVSASATAGTVSVNDNKITWTVSPDEADGAKLTINGNLKNDPCLQGLTIQNTASYSATDKEGCELRGSSASFVYINNNPNNVVNQQKFASGSLETCNSEGITITNEYTIGTGVAGVWNGTSLTDDLHGGDLCYIDGSAEFNFDTDDGDDENWTGWQAVPSNYVSVDGDGKLHIDLSFLSAIDSTGGGEDNVAGNNLKVRYKVYACEDKLDGAPVVLWDTISDLSINGNEGSCSTQTGHYLQHLVVTAKRANIGVEISLPPVVEDCGTYDMEIKVNQLADVPYHDLKVEFPTDNYAYLGDLSVSGFNDKAPTVDKSNPNKVVFSFDGEISESGTLTFKVRKKCGTQPNVSTTATYKSREDNGTEASSCCNGTCGGVERSVSASASPVLSNRGDLIVNVTPEDYPVTEKELRWKIYVTNRGSGTAYNVKVEDILGPNFHYESSTIDGNNTSPTVKENDPSSGFTRVIWSLGDIPAKETKVIEVVISLTGHSCDVNDDSSTINVFWGCGEETCQSITNINLPHFSQPDSEAITINSFPASVEMCSDEGEVILQLKNSGLTTVYRAEVIQDLLDTEAKYVTGSAQVSTDGSSWSSASDPKTEGTKLIWQGYDSSDDGYLEELKEVESGKSVYIKFKIATNCSVAENPLLASFGSYQKPCQVGSDERETIDNQYRLIPVKEPNLQITVEARNATQGTDWTQGNVYAVNGDIVQYRIKVKNSGTAPAKNVSLRDELPSNLNFVSITSQDVEDGGVKGGSYPEWEVEDVDPGDEDIYIIEAQVSSCGDDASNDVIVSYGCPANEPYFDEPCRDFSIVGSHGLYGKLITKPKLETSIRLTSSELTTCSGTLTIKVHNDGAKTGAIEHVKAILPEGWVYDGSGEGTTIMYKKGESDTTANHSISTEEPSLEGGDGHKPVWSSSNGNFDYIDTGETLTITYRVKPDGAYCDNNLSEDPSHPSFNVQTQVKVNDSCNNPTTISDTLTVDPTYPDVDIKIIPYKQVAGEDEVVTFRVKLKNNGTTTAKNLKLVLYLGDGFTVVSANKGGEIDNSSVPRTVTWEDSDINGGAGIPPGGTWRARVKARLEGGNLQVYGIVEGWCKDQGGNLVCRHSYDRAKAYVAGVNFSKEIAEIKEPGSVVNSRQGKATIGNVVVFDLKVKLLGNGTYSAVNLTDVIPSGFEFIDAYFDGNNDSNYVLIPSDGSYSSSDGGLRAKYTSSDGVYTFTVDDDSDGNNDPSFAVDTAPKYLDIRIRARVKNVDENTAGEELTNNSYLDFSYDNGDGNSKDYSHTDFSALNDSAKVVVIEPRLQAFKSYPGWGSTYSSSNPKEVAAGEDIEFTLKFENWSGSNASPAFDVVITDVIPAGMRQTAPVISQVFIDTNGNDSYDDGVDRQLTSGTDYSTSWEPSSGNLTIALLNGSNGEVSNTNIIAPGEALIIKYTGHVDDDAGAGLDLRNQARGSYSSIRGEPISPEADERSYETPLVETLLTTGKASVVKESTLNGSAVVDGGEIVYTLTFPNPVQDVFLYGDDDDSEPAGEPEFVDIIPDGLEVTSVSITVNPSYACQQFGGEIVPPYRGGSGACAVDDRVFNVSISPTVSGGRNRKVEINFNKLYPGDYLVVTIKAKVHPTFDDGSQVEEGHPFENQATITVYTKPSSDPNREERSYTSNRVATLYKKLVGITPDRSSQASPGNWVIYEHTVNNLTSQDVQVCFSISSSKGWGWVITDSNEVILVDENGNSVNSLTVPANEAVKIYVKYFVPSDTPGGTVDAANIFLHPFSGTCNRDITYDEVSDTTAVITSSGLQLTKEVRRCDKSDINSCEEFSYQNSAFPCDYLEYKISFKNLSSQAYVGLSISDIIPDHTEFVENAYGPGRDVLLHKPDGSETFLDVSITGNTLEVELSSQIPSLNPGEEGWIQYKVRVIGDSCP